MNTRSEFLAATTTLATLKLFSDHITPKPKYPDFNFHTCWIWTGTIAKGSTRTKKRRSGEGWSFVTETEPDRPYLYLHPIGKLDPRRVLFELFQPQRGTSTYFISQNCGKPLCCNPKHQEYKPFQMRNDDTIRRYPTYFDANSPFFEHTIATFNPKRIQFGTETAISEAKQTPPLPIQPKPPSASPTPISLPFQIKDAMGVIRGRGEYKETDYGATLLVYSAKTHWITVMNSAFPIGIIGNWLERWGDLIPDFPTINGFGVECVADAFEKLDKPANLSQLLAAEDFRFHPKLVLDWYSELESKETIDMNK